MPPITKPMLRLEQHKLYSMAKEWRSGNLACKLTSQPSLGWRHQIHRRVEIKGRELERVGGTFMTCHENREQRTEVWFGPRTDATLLFRPCMGFPVVVMAAVNCLMLLGVSFS